MDVAAPPEPLHRPGPLDSDQSERGERNALLRRDHDVVEDADIDEPQGAYQAAGQSLIGAAVRRWPQGEHGSRFTIAAWTAARYLERSLGRRSFPPRVVGSGPRRALFANPQRKVSEA